MFEKIAFWLRGKSYRKAFETWFNSGDRLLWVDDVLFIPIAITITEVLPGHASRIWTWGCDGKESYFKSGFLDIKMFGEMIIKGTITERMRKNMFPISEQAFFECLNIYNNMSKDKMWSIRYKFGYENINFYQLPGWLYTKLKE